MKKVYLILLACLPTLYASAQSADPWICTAVGTKMVYTISFGNERLGELAKTVTSFENNVATIRTTQKGKAAVDEYWHIYPDSTVLRIELPQAVVDNLKAMNVSQIESRADNMALPSELKAGNSLHGFGFSIAGTKDGKRDTISVVSDSIRVIGEEEIKTPAGKFSAVRIEMQSRTIVSGESTDVPMTQWLVRGIGVVRQEVRSQVTPEFAIVKVQELKKIIKAK